MSRRRGESIEDFKKRDAARKREERLRKVLASKPVKALAIPARVVPPTLTADKREPVNGLEAVVRLHDRIALALRAEDLAAADGALRTEGQRMRHAKRLYLECKAFQHLAGGLKVMQALATRDEVQEIVELVDPHLPDAVRDQLQAVLQRIDARAGVAA